MRVLFLQQQPCMRALKYAVGLRAARPDLVLRFAFKGQTLSEWYGSGDELFDDWHSLGPRPAAELGRVIDEFAPDVIHSHNLPDSLTVLALELADGRIPVIHDVHDLQSLRRTPYEDGFPEPADALDLERAALEGSDAVVTVSDELLDEIRARYDARAVTRVFPNYALRRDLPSPLPPADRRRDGAVRLVYQGTLSTNGGHYDFRDLFECVVAQGISLDIYPSRPAPAYESLAHGSDGLHCHPRLEPRRLLQALTAYDFGWAGFNARINAAHLDTALPNKLYEYVACGLPVLTLGHRALARVIEDAGIGASLPTLEDLPAQLAALDLVVLRTQVAAVRPALTVEANIHEIVDLYDSVAG